MDKASNATPPHATETDLIVFMIPSFIRIVLDDLDQTIVLFSRPHDQHTSVHQQVARDLPRRFRYPDVIDVETAFVHKPPRVPLALAEP
jgi:hypothetical protein